MSFDFYMRSQVLCEFLKLFKNDRIALILACFMGSKFQVYEGVRKRSLLWNYSNLSRRIYAEMGYSSLFEFAVKELKYSEGAAGRRISAMRLMREVPSLEEQVRSGDLNVTVISMAKRATDGKSVAEKIEVLEKLEGSTQKEAERTLAALYPEQVQAKESEKAISESLTEIRFTADAELLEKFEKIRNLLSHQKPNASYQELFHLMSDQLLKKMGLEEKEKKASHSIPSASSAHPTRSMDQRHTANPTSSVTPLPEKQCIIKTRSSTHSVAQLRSRSGAPSRSRYIPRAFKREVWQKAQGQCSYIDFKSGRRCSSRHLLQIDHRIPLAMGGETSAENLFLKSDDRRDRTVNSSSK